MVEEDKSRCEEEKMKKLFFISLVMLSIFCISHLEAMIYLENQTGLPDEKLFVILGIPSGKQKKYPFTKNFEFIKHLIELGFPTRVKAEKDAAKAIEAWNKMQEAYDQIIVKIGAIGDPIMAKIHGDGGIAIPSTYIINYNAQKKLQAINILEE